MVFLHHEGGYANVLRPDLILLKLNLPRKDGREVLAEIKADDSLKHIPVVILTTSQAEEDVVKAYEATPIATSLSRSILTASLRSSNLSKTFG